MKLQNLIIIFLAIALPVILILSIYVGLQVDTAKLKAKYNDYIVTAAHETILAFQINTKNNINENQGIDYSEIADTKIKDIEAAINVFSSSLANSFGRTGTSKSFMMSYVPALVFSLYDGYYIYSPAEKEWDVEKGKWIDIPLKHELKSYVYYSKTYNNGNKVLTINYSLDNYVAVYYYNGSNYESKSGYLEVIPNTDMAKDNFKNSLDDLVAKKYYDEAWNFTEWFNDIVKNWKKDNLEETLTINSSNSAMPGESSNFNDEKYNVIKDSIISNLVPAMQTYGYQMPELTDADWDLILNNVCFTAFMQNMPMGTTIYNNYTIAVSTENKETINENDIYFVNTEIDDEGIEQIKGSYHRIWCPELVANDADLNIKGYNKIEFKSNDKLKLVHACYNCMIKASDPKFSYAEEYAKNANSVIYKLEKRRNAYLTSLAREKRNLFKPSEFINGSTKLNKI